MRAYFNFQKTEPSPPHRLSDLKEYHIRTFVVETLGELLQAELINTEVEIAENNGDCTDFV